MSYVRVWCLVDDASIPFRRYDKPAVICLEDVSTVSPGTSEGVCFITMKTGQRFIVSLEEAAHLEALIFYRGSENP